MEQIDEYRKHGLWNGGDINKQGGYLVAWSKATRPKEEGELGILNIKHQNRALLMKFLHKFYNKINVPWVNLTCHHFYSNRKPPHSRRPLGSFWWKDVLSNNEHYRAISSCEVGDGRSLAFWDDMWDLRVPSQSFPQLYAYARDKKVSVYQFYTRSSVIWHFPYH